MCGGAATFFDPALGAITNPGPAPTGIIGETFTLISNCTGPGCIPGPPTTSPPATIKYYPAQMSLTATGRKNTMKAYSLADVKGYLDGDDTPEGMVLANFYQR